MCRELTARVDSPLTFMVDFLGFLNRSRPAAEDNHGTIVLIFALRVVLPHMHIDGNRIHLPVPRGERPARPPAAELGHRPPGSRSEPVQVRTRGCQIGARFPTQSGNAAARGGQTQYR